MAASLPKVKKASLLLDEPPEKLSVVDRVVYRIVEALTVEDLVRGILQKVSAPSPSSPEIKEGAEAILGLDIDGFHYSLVRSRSSHSRHLSSREQEIARLVAEGLPNKCISNVLEISTWTVATHLRRIFAKLGVNSRAAMVARLLDEGLMGEQFTYGEGISRRRR